jgi:hypothetical protein
VKASDGKAMAQARGTAMRTQRRAAAEDGAVQSSERVRGGEVSASVTGRKDKVRAGSGSVAFRSSELPFTSK